MADAPTKAADASTSEASHGSAASVLGSATYEVIRQRLHKQGTLLRERIQLLDTARDEVFGSIELKLLHADRITTAHNCIPRDMAQLGNGRFLFGFNVQFGLKKEIEVADVFAIYNRDAESGAFKEAPLDEVLDAQFIIDFKRLYNVYHQTFFSKFSLIGNSLFMVFRTGVGINDIAVFKWVFQAGALRYADGRAETEYKKVAFPPQYDFRWQVPDRESFRYGEHPHISIEDRVFIDCVRGDITIKVEDNTKTGEGIYAEPVTDKNQKIDDAEISYAILEPLILLKVRPYKETDYRYFIFHEKLQQAVRVDSIGQACVLLPEDHGIIFPDGYYLNIGDLKRFESRELGMVTERIIHSPNGQDSLFVFYNRETGDYVLMPYQLITQKVDERISCHGFSLFPNGHMVSFRGEAEPQKHHMVQLRQTPFYQPGFEPEGNKNSFLYKVGNKDVVRCLSELNSILALVDKPDPYAELYVDLVKRCDAILDAYQWLATDNGYSISQSLKELRRIADQAVEEFDKVQRLQREALLKVEELRKRCDERYGFIKRSPLNSLADFVTNLTALRHLRGDIITAREIRYISQEGLNALETQVSNETATLSKACVKFLLKPESLHNYKALAEQYLASIDKVSKSAEGKSIEKDVLKAGTELEMLIEIVNSLKIEDPTETTRIIDGITAIYSTLNQVKAGLKKRLQSLAASEGAAQFSAQIKLLSQAATSYLDLCDSPAKCDDYLNRITVQLEELEGAFADFEDYLVQLSDKRAELYEAFEQRKTGLVEQRNKKASALLAAADRILKVIQNRLAGFKSIEDINTYIASDLMAAKVRETIDQLLALGDTVKSDDLQSRLKSVQQDAVRQLKDKQELFAGGDNLIQLGKHRFNVNTQPLDLTVVNRGGVPHFHLTSTNFFEEITDPAYLETRNAWNQEIVSENDSVYRAEYLAYNLLRQIESEQKLDEVAGASEEKQLELVHAFIANRYQEGYTKGIHDIDGVKIFRALASIHHALQLARYHPSTRACALIFWECFCLEPDRALWTAKLKGLAERNKAFGMEAEQQTYITELQALLTAFAEKIQLYTANIVERAGEYLFHELVSGDSFVITREASQQAAGFQKHLASKGFERAYEQATQALAQHPASRLELIRDWLRGYLTSANLLDTYLDEIAAFLFCGKNLKRVIVNCITTADLTEMRGAHPVINGNAYRLDYLPFIEKLARFQNETVACFQRYHLAKQLLVERERARLRLDQFTPKVLTSFVRNQLIDEVYLPVVGDNLAKQIGAAGSQKRTDLMGMLLLISPPGYGKTTLLEYIASRLGSVFVKINGPAIGHSVTSLDPQEAPNAAAREEIHKLNLALEMGDNVLICVDDIQHCHAEFLQKFISLCDAQRKIEGVWKGQSKTYDLRGRKVVVVMAGNPYTESGQKFKIPDMLANRADTYNLGDIIGGKEQYFKSSYLENAVTSNAVLAPLANKSQKDIRTFIRMAETGTSELNGFEASYSSQEVEEISSVFKKLVRIREVILRVNQEYIYSAAQADEFRTEPPFKLQGSYRNMNRLTEKVVAIMNDAEVDQILLDHYRGESQTLTTGAEANFLKFKHMMGWQTPEEHSRWNDILKTFKRNQLVRGADQSDPAGRVVAQLSAFEAGLTSIKDTLEKKLSREPAPITLDLGPLKPLLENLSRSKPGNLEVAPVTEIVDALRQDLSRIADVSHQVKMLHSTLASLKDVTAQQRTYLQKVEELLNARVKQGVVELDLTQEMLTNEQAFLDRVHKVLNDLNYSPQENGKKNEKAN